MASRKIIMDGDTFILFGGDYQRQHLIRPNTTVKLGKNGSVHIGSVIGHPFGTFFEVDMKKKQLVPVKPDAMESAAQCFAGTDPATAFSDALHSPTKADDGKIKDNRYLLEANQGSQKLTQQDIEKIKQEKGITAVVDELIMHSETFSDKTTFSQEKYIKRKSKKYQTFYIAEQTTIDRYCELFNPTKSMSTSFKVDDARCIRLRVDSAAQLLHLANVRGNGRVMVIDGTNGTLPAAVMERLGPNGRIVQVCDVLGHSAQPVMQVARQMLLPDVKERWTAVEFRDLIAPQGDYSGEASKSKHGADAEKCGDTQKDVNTTERQSQWIRGAEAHHMMMETQCDSCIVCVDDDAATLASIMRRIWPYLAPSASVAVYSPSMSALEGLFRTLRDELKAILTTIRETWFRDYQVLPDRTHPNVNMNHNGGYLLSCTKIIPLGSVPSANKRLRE